MALAPLSAAHGTRSFQDNTTGDEHYIVKVYEIHEQKIIGVYVPYYYFTIVSLWEQHKLGKTISETLNLAQCTNKFLFVDNLVEDESDVIDETYMNNLMDHVVLTNFVNGTQDPNISEDKENILCFTTCFECLKICTIKCQHLHLNIMKDSHYCVKCISDIISPVFSSEYSFDESD